MQNIVITLPQFFAEEAEMIVGMFQSGLRRLHLRKPDSTADECRRLLDAVPSVYYDRIVTHDHFELAAEYGLAGVHLNGRNPNVPKGWGGTVSTSCHSIEELKEKKSYGYTDAEGNRRQYDYLTLSPIFDSVSKKGYKSAFCEDDLLSAAREGIVDEEVMALGGITRENVGRIPALGFGGALMLGDAWVKHTSCGSYLPVVLTIAGSDTSAGAGIQQDLKTLTNLHCYAATVITAITSQNTLGVQGVDIVSGEVIERQLQSVFSDMRVEAVKIGMIPNRKVAEDVVRVLREEQQKYCLPIVLDPIMLSTSGRQLMDEDCIDYVASELMPMCTLVTPNIPEYEYLCGHDIHIPTNYLLKGGHAEGNKMTDVLHLCVEQAYVEYSSPRIETTNLHGTGCTLSSAIAAGLAHGHSLQYAVRDAKLYMDKAILGGRDLHVGHGNGPLWMEPAG